MKHKSFFKAVKGCAVAVVLIFFLCLPVAAFGEGEGGEENDTCILFGATETEDGILELTVSLDSEHGICAMLSSLEYNPESLIYLSGGAETVGFSFKAVDFGGYVRFLLDGVENSAPKVALAKFYFKRKDDGEERFSLRCNEAVYLDRDGEPLGATVKIVNLNDSRDTAEKEKEISPEIVELENTSGKISFSVKVGGSDFAAGARLFFVDLGGEGEHFDVCVAGVVGEDGIFKGEYRAEATKSYLVIVTAQGFGARTVTKGEKKLVFLGKTISTSYGQQTNNRNILFIADK